jgi:hypothetical protein
MSLPDKFNSGKSDSDSDSDIIYSQPNRYSNLTPNEREIADQKINEFDNYIQKIFEVYLNSLGNELENYTADEIEFANSEGNDEANFFYFIGRLNPPHDGHIYALKELVSNAMSNNSKALILLGSGPKQSDGDKRTMENPIPFELKKEFIEQQLQSIGAVEGTNYIIKEMTSPHGDLAGFIHESLKNKVVSDIKEIKIKHFAGGKDEDASKLKSILEFAETMAKKENPNADVLANVEVIQPKQSSSESKAMSATEVRKSVYSSYLDGTGYNGWSQQYKDFYGPMAQQIYEEILYPIYKLRNNDVSKDEIIRLVNEYIVEGKLPKTSKKSVKKRGGTKRGKTKRKQKNSKTKRLNKSNNSKGKSKKITKRRYKLVTK